CSMAVWEFSNVAGSPQLFLRREILRLQLPSYVLLRAVHCLPRATRRFLERDGTRPWLRHSHHAPGLRLGDLDAAYKTIVSMRFFALLLVLSRALSAHVGSPDIYYDGNAGPYRLAVTIRPPQVIPGVAEIEIRSDTPGVRRLQIVPIPIAGAGAKFSPTPDIAQPSKDDPQFFTG